VGILVGHFFDRGLSRNLRLTSGPEAEKARQVFFSTGFALMGYLAKADGRVSDQEIANAEEVMRQLGLDPERRAEAIGHFKLGVAENFDLDSQLAEYREYCVVHPNLNNMLLVMLVSIALADGELHHNEETILQRVAAVLGYDERSFGRLLNMVQAQRRFHEQTTGGRRFDQTTTSRDALKDAYEALGVSPQDSDQLIKMAYRKLMSQNHPDKLIAQGVPADMVKLATEKSQDIQNAYDLIKAARKSGRKN